MSNVVVLRDTSSRLRFKIGSVYRLGPSLILDTLLVVAKVLQIDCENVCLVAL